MFVITHKSIFLVISVFAISFSAVSLAMYGLNPSIDFSGGTIYEVSYTTDRPTLGSIRSRIQTIAPGAVLQSTGEQGVIIKTTEITDEQKNEIDAVLSQNDGAYEELRFKQLGPAISTELQNKSIFAILFVVLVTIGFIAYTFNSVSKPVASYKYGLVAVVALIHDTIIPIGLFAMLGSIFIDYQIDVLFVTAILATLGYSVNDTIVVFDRVRENLRLAHENNKPFEKEAFRDLVGLSLKQTFMRSLYTSLTTLMALAFLFFMGGDATKPFALVLGIGVIAGTYSSLFLACPLLVWIESRQKHSLLDEEVQDSQDSDDDLPDDIKQFLKKRNNSN